MAASRCLIWSPRGAPAGPGPDDAVREQLGYLFLAPDPDRRGDSWTEYDPAPVLTAHRREHDTLIIHKSDYPQLTAALAGSRA